MSFAHPKNNDKINNELNDYDNQLIKIINILRNNNERNCAKNKNMPITQYYKHYQKD